VLQKVKNLYLRQDMVSLVSASIWGTEATPLICALHVLPSEFDILSTPSPPRK
jgi:hypothetical protein